jgi:hypothetical protein
VFVGLTTDKPPAIVYVLAPLGLMVKLPPEQMLPLFTLITGDVSTVTLLIAASVLTQPARLVPITL